MFQSRKIFSLLLAVSYMMLLVGNLVDVEALVDMETNMCGLKVFVPFTFQGISTTYLSAGPKSTGFSHMAAAWLAMEHFNARNSSVVSELADKSSYMKDCKIQFDLGQRLDTDRYNQSSIASNTFIPGTFFVDSSSEGHQAAQLVFQSVRPTGYEVTTSRACAFVGPYNDGPAMDIATMAATARIPQIPSGGMDGRLSEGLFSPFTSVIYPRIFDVTVVLLRFLILHKRTNFISILFAYSDVSLQMNEALGLSMGMLNVSQTQSLGYWSSFAALSSPTGQTMRDNIRKIKERGYRTIIVVMGDGSQDLPLIADAAEEFGLNTEEYMWIFLPPFRMEAVPGLLAMEESLRKKLDPPVPAYTNVPKLLRGAALIHPVEGFQIDADHDKFAQAWKSVDASFIERLNNQATILNAQGLVLAGKSSEQASLEYFLTTAPEPGSSFVYDAVMSVGLGACLADKQRRVNETSSEGQPQIISSEEQIAGIRSVNFQGSTGQIEFGESMGLLAPIQGARQSKGLTMGIFNLFPPTFEAEEANVSSVLTATYSDLLDRQQTDDLLRGGDISNFITIDEYRPFVFRDGTTTAPKLLRDPTNQNYLSPALRYVGLSLMALALLCCVVCGIWIVVNWNHRIVLAAQPYNLLLLLLGAVITSSSIFFVSTDENWGFSVEQLDRHCMAIVWLASVGHIVTYSSLFMKLWRVFGVLQISEQHVAPNQIAWPAALFMVAALTLLALWQALDPLRWKRIELDIVSGESIGQCDSDAMAYYVVALSIVLMIPSILTGWVARKTKHVSDEYSDFSSIFTLIVVQLEVIIVAFPLVVVLREVSTDGKFIGLVLLLWSMPMSTILLIMLPKIVTHYKVEHGISTDHSVRGSRGGGRVSGMNSTDSNGRTSNQTIPVRPPHNSNDELDVVKDDSDEFAAE